MSDLIVVTPDTKAIEIYDAKKLPLILEAIEKEVRSFVPDLKNATTRKEIASIAHKVSRSKTFLDEKGKGLTEEWRAKVGAINEQRSQIKERMDALKIEVRKPLTEFEESEKVRVKTYRAHIDVMEKLGDRLFNLSLTSNEVSRNIEKLNDWVIDEEWLEFEEEAIETRSKSIESAKETLEEIKVKEEEAIELKKLREEASARKVKDHEDKIAREAAEKVQKEANEKAALEAKKLQDEKDKLEKEKEDSKRRAREFEEREKQAKIKAEQDKKDAVRIKTEPTSTVLVHREPAKHQKVCLTRPRGLCG